MAEGGLAWSFEFEIDPDYDVALIAVRSLDGLDFQILAEVRFAADAIELRDAHVQGAGPNSVGTANLLRLARHVKERLGVAVVRLKERFERLGPVRVAGRSRSSSDADRRLFLLIVRGPFARAIDAAKLLVELGMSLGEAHATVSALAETGYVSARLVAARLCDEARDRFAALGLSLVGRSGGRQPSYEAGKRKLGLSDAAMAELLRLPPGTLDATAGRRDADPTLSLYLDVVAGLLDEADAARNPHAAARDRARHAV
jgi:hypothetical protein